MSGTGASYEADAQKYFDAKLCAYKHSIADDVLLDGLKDVAKNALFIGNNRYVESADGSYPWEADCEVDVSFAWAEAAEECTKTTTASIAGVPGSPVSTSVSSFECCSAGIADGDAGLILACPVSYSWLEPSRQCIKAYVTEMEASSATLAGHTVDPAECCEAGTGANQDPQLERACPISAYDRIETLSFPPRNQEWPTPAAL